MLNYAAFRKSFCIKMFAFAKCKLQKYFGQFKILIL